ncbi:MAG: hypothetical protein ACLRWQ_07730 [Flavonifractor plautii]
MEAGGDGAAGGVTLPAGTGPAGSGDQAALHKPRVTDRPDAGRFAVQELSVGDTVLFAATEPYGGPGDFALRGGVIQSIDPERKTCSVQGRFFPMDDVPLHYVLGSYDRSVSEEHYGFPHIRPLLGEHPELAERYLREAEARWNTLCGQPAVSSEVPKNTMQAMGGMS